MRVGGGIVRWGAELAGAHIRSAPTPMAGAFGGLSRDGFMIEVYTQLSQLRQAHASSLDGVLDAVGALTQLAENLVSAPADERRHRVRIGNPRFFQRVGRLLVRGPGPPPCAPPAASD